jgi:hypothetical protein
MPQYGILYFSIHSAPTYIFMMGFSVELNFCPKFAQTNPSIEDSASPN